MIEVSGSSTTSPRPDKFTTDEWRRIPHGKRKEIIKAQEMESDAAVEKRKLEKKVKEAEEKALKKLEEGKKKKDEKKASGSKDKSRDHDAGVPVKQDHVRHGKVFHYSGNLLPPSGRASFAAVVDSDLTDTDVPDDEDFLMDWDEKSGIENGFGPKATWTQDNGYDFESGKVIAAAPRSFHPGDTTQDINDLGVLIHSHVCLVLTNMNTIARRLVATTMVSISTSYSTPQLLGLLVDKK